MVARNPEADSKLPYLLWVPLGERGLVFNARDTWPRTAAIYCHPVDDWPADAEVVERLPVRSCVRRGAAVDLVLARGRENRSQFVFTTARGREVVFWQSPRTVKQSRPGVRRPTARAGGLAELEVLVDIRERYPYRFADQRVTVARRALPAGDYATTLADQIVACMERKSLADLVSSLTGSRLKYQLADLAALPRAAIVVEDRYAAVFKLDRVRPAVVADALAELQVAWPAVPIVFADTRAPRRGMDLPVAGRSGPPRPRRHRHHQPTVRPPRAHRTTYRATYRTADHRPGQSLGPHHRTRRATTRAARTRRLGRLPPRTPRNAGVKTGGGPQAVLLLWTSDRADPNGPSAIQFIPQPVA